MLEVINLVLACFIQTISWGIVISQISNKKINYKKVSNIILLFALLFLVSIIQFINFGALKPIIIYCIITIFYKYIFSITFNESAIINLISMILHIIAEMIITFNLMVFNINDMTIIKLLNFTPFSSLIILLIIMFFTIILKKPLRYTNNILKKDRISLFIYIIAIIGMSFFLFKNINLSNNWKVDKESWLNLITTSTFTIMMILLINEKLKIHKVNKDYKNLIIQDKNTSELIRKYQKINHESKNDLTIIKSQVTNNKELVQHIDNIIGEKEISDNEKQIEELTKISEPKIRYFISQKINKMLRKNIKVSLLISKNVRKFDFNKFNIAEYKEIYRVIGIFIDNAIEASIKSNRREVTLEITFHNHKLSIIIANTFDKIPELNKIDDIGFTTKGIGRGIGRSLALDIISKNKYLYQDKKIIKDYFYQYIYISEKIYNI